MLAGRTNSDDPPATGLPRGLVDESARGPLLALFAGGAVWLIVGSVFALVSSIKFHSPNFLADWAWLTFGRVRPAASNVLLYGFCVPAGLGTGLWLLARLGQTRVRLGWLAAFGALLWHLGVVTGVYGILTGDSTGFENLEFPSYAAIILFLGYLQIGLSLAATFHHRQVRVLFPSQWFVLTAVFWFPWIYSSAIPLLHFFPVRGIGQAVIAWWYSENLQTVWMWLVGLGTILYFLPKLTGRELHNRGLALFAYLGVIFFGTWAGIPTTAPVPSWLPTASTGATMLLALPLVALALMAHRTVGGNYRAFRGDISLAFVGLALLSLLLAGAMQIVLALGPAGQVLDFTWFVPAQVQLNNYGFFALAMFGAIYHVVPLVMGAEWPRPRLVRAHLYTAAAGVLLLCLPLAVGGILQGVKLHEPALPFVAISKFTLHFLRVSTIGELLLTVGHCLFLLNLTNLVWNLARARSKALVAAATQELYPAEGVTS